MSAVVSDTSPLIYLTRLGHFSWLKEFYAEVLIPPAVWQELVNQGAAYPEAAETRHAVQLGWMRVTAPSSSIKIVELCELNSGECEAIVLARELGALLIIDEAEGRAAAVKLGIPVTGTLGLLLEAKSRALIPNLRSELDRLTNLTTFRISTELKKLVLQRAGEDDSKR